MTGRRLDGSTVLVTGGHGVIGSWVCAELAGRGARVVVLDLAPAPVVRLGPPPAATIVADLRDPGVLPHVLDAHGIARVIHLAGIIGEVAEARPQLAIEVNALATARLLDAALDAGLERVVAMSTKGVLGQLHPRHLRPIWDPVPVDAPVNPHSMYEVTKAVVESLIHRARDRGLSAAGVRLATNWGAGKTAESHAGYSLHSDVVSRAIAGESSALDIAPDHGSDIVYYGDVARGLVDACAAEALPRPIYHVGSGRITTLGTFAEAVEAAFPGVRVVLGERYPGGRACVLDIAPAREDLGYEPAFGLAGALAHAKALADGGAAPAADAGG